jgi:hypothetical protein
VIFKRLPRLKHEASEEKYLKKLEEDIQVAYGQIREINLIKFQHQDSEEGIKKIKEQLQKILKSRGKLGSALPLMPTFIIGNTTGVITSTLLMFVPHLIKAATPEGQFTVSIINNTDKSIEVSFYHKSIGVFLYSSSIKNWTIPPEGKKSYSFKSWDSELWTTAYESSVTYDGKTAKFWAFGEEAPRSDNTIIIKADGIYLDGHKYASWE